MLIRNAEKCNCYCFKFYFGGKGFNGLNDGRRRRRRRRKMVVPRAAAGYARQLKIKLENATRLLMSTQEFMNFHRVIIWMFQSFKRLQTDGLSNFEDDRSIAELTLFYTGSGRYIITRGGAQSAPEYKNAL